MEIKSFIPKSPKMYSLTFPMDEGWAIVAALSEYADKHPQAAHTDKWRQWAITLDRELKS